MKITIEGYKQPIILKKQPLSIFDKNIAGQIATDGKYYIICRNHKTHEIYAVENFFDWLNNIGGKTLEESEEPQCFNNEWVRAMTYSEERAWNEDRLMLNVDAWGNVELNNTFDIEWYIENCI